MLRLFWSINMNLVSFQLIKPSSLQEVFAHTILRSGLKIQIYFDQNLELFLQQHQIRSKNNFFNRPIAGNQQSVVSVSTQQLITCILSSQPQGPSFFQDLERKKDLEVGLIKCT